jgi:hypothetical protein
VSGQSLGNSRPVINSNFQLIQSVFDENHVDFNDANAGFHTFVDLLSQGTTPANPPTGSVSHYSNAVLGVTEWFFQFETSGTAVQMSNINGTPVASVNGQTFLPGGLIMKFGTLAVNFPTNARITYQSAFPTNLFSFQVTVSASATVTYTLPTSLVNLTGFNIASLYTGQAFVYWMAIGN